jgi:phage protein
MNDYKQRMIEEYKQLAERFIKLGRLIEKHNSGTLDFKPACPMELLEDQYCAMRLYLNTLVQRATIEGINFNDIEIEAGDTE